MRYATAMMCAALLAFLGSLPAAPANDDNVFWDGLFHDPTSAQYLQTIPDGLTLTLRVFDGDLTAIRLEYFDGARWNSLPLRYDQDLDDCGGAGLSFPCDLWVTESAVPFSSGAQAYRFAAVDGADTQYVGVGAPSRVFDDGVVPDVVDCFPFPDRPDAGAYDAGRLADAAAPDAMIPDASQPPDATPPRDAGASVDAADAAAMWDASAPDGADAADTPDAWLTDTGIPHSLDSSTPLDAGQDGGHAVCRPGCASAGERVVCSAERPVILACTAGTECLNGVCVSPRPEEPLPRGCQCGVFQSNSRWLFVVPGLVGWAATVRWRRRPCRWAAP
jgi:hypothetical protein